MTSTRTATSDHRLAGEGFRWWRVVAALAVVPVTMAGLALVAGGWWVGELVSHFRFHIAICLAVAGLVFIAARRWGWLLACVLTVGLQLPWIGPYLWWGDGGGTGRDLRVAVLNVHTANRDHDAVIAWIRAEAPDCVVVLEVDDRWLAALRAGLPAWSHGEALPRPDNFGIALLSRRPLARVQVSEFTAAELPNIGAELIVDGQRCRVVGTHPPPPIGARGNALRDAVFARLPEFSAATGPRVLLGDLNCTPCSPAFAELCVAAGLRDSARGFGWCPTWPSALGPLGLPIDHCLVSSEWRVLDRRIGPVVGSDHRPLVVDLAFE